MVSYSGRHAELYDLFYADKPYAAEAAFVDQCLNNYSIGPANRLLEIACGTGTHAFHLEKPERTIIATDYSEAMLRRARQKAADKHSRVEFQLQDMTELAVSTEMFDAVICLFDAIGYVRTNEALSKTFHGVHKHLRPNGLFIFEFWHAAAMLRHYDPLRVRRWKTGDSEVLRISETVLDTANQLSNVTYSIYELKNNATYSALTETQVNRYFLLREMEQWLTWMRFAPVKWFAGFTNDETITDETWHIVAVARRI
ncbi:MAG TPA: class I SAM-dependent methyltransferase [Pyrinomonadaceae bacterium]|nr:class I SAM-dependent methyltransferase [Pyrinomonadaceae bacterium]